MAGEYASQNGLLYRMGGAINPRYHPLRGSLILTVAGVGAAVIIYLFSGGAPSIPSQDLSFGNKNPPQQSGQQSSSSLDGLVAGTPTPFINTPTPYPTATATPNPDPYGAKALIAEINKTEGNATPGQIGAWARAALEMHGLRSKDNYSLAELVMRATMYAAFSRSDSEGVYEISKACAEWEGIPLDYPIDGDLKKSSERRWQDYNSSRDRSASITSWIWGMLRGDCLSGPPKRN